MFRKTVDILGIKIDIATKEEIINRLDILMKQKSKSMIATVNSEFVVRAQNDKDFAKILNDESKINIADGAGILWSARFLTLNKITVGWLNCLFLPLSWFFSLVTIVLYPKYILDPIPEKISGSDFIWDIARFAANNKYKIFLAGGAPTVAERTALQLQTSIPDLRVAGVHSGSSEDVKDILATVNRSHADILLVAYGAPKQEKWLRQNLKKTCCKLGIGLGGTFDFIAGTRMRSPKIIQKVGLEWLFRLIQEPKRFKRQLAIPRLIWLTLKKRLSNQ